MPLVQPQSLKVALLHLAFDLSKTAEILSVYQWSLNVFLEICARTKHMRLSGYFNSSEHLGLLFTCENILANESLKFSLNRN
jgi:hypothetical protein